MCSINGVTFLKALTRDKFNPRISFVSLDYSHLSWSWQPCEDKSGVIQYFHVSPFYTGQERSRPALTVHHKSHVRSQCIPCTAHISRLAACYITVTVSHEYWRWEGPRHLPAVNFPCVVSPCNFSVRNLNLFIGVMARGC